MYADGLREVFEDAVWIVGQALTEKSFTTIAGVKCIINNILEMSDRSMVYLRD